MARGRRALRALAIVAVLLVGLLIVAAVLTQTAWFRERLRRLAVRQAEAAIEGRLEIGSIEGDLLHGVTLREVAVVQGDVRVVRVGRVQLTYGVGDLASTGRTVRQITIDQPVIEAIRTPQGWNVARLLKPRPPADPNKPRATFTLPEILVTNAVVTVREIGVAQTQAIPRRMEGLTFEGGIASSPREFSADIRRLTFRAGQPDLDLRSLAGRIVSVPNGWRFQTVTARTAESTLTVDGTLTRSPATSPWAFDLDVTGQPVSLPEISRFIPATAFELHPRLAVGVTGTVDALKLDVDVTQSEAGRAKGSLSIDTTAPIRGLAGHLTVADVNLAPIVKDPVAAGRITGDATFDLRFPSATAGFPVDGTYTFTGPRASGYGYEATNVKATGSLDGRNIRLDASANAYGGSASTKGTIARAGQGQRELTLDLAGRVAGVDLRNLPAALRIPTLEADLTGTYTVRGALSSVKADAVLDPSTVEGATLVDGTVGSFQRTSRGFTFGAAGTVAGLDLQRLGRRLKVPAMTDPRLSGVVNGTFDVAGEQRGREGVRVEASGTLTDTRVYEGYVPQMGFTATLDGNRLDVAAKGRAEDFELETVSETPAATGVLRGDVDVRVALPDVRAVSLDTVGVEGTVTLDTPTLFDVPFTTVGADLTLAGGLLTVRRLDGRGDGFTLTGNGAVGLGPDDVSDFRYRIEADSLVNPTKVADLPITGSATTEGRITGTRADFLVTGTMAGDQVAYSDTVAAGTVTAQYAVRVPDFDPERVDVQTSIDGQQVQVAGQVLSTVTGTIGYTTDLVRFDASGTDALRALAARGTLRLEDGGQRLTLEQAQVSREGVQWGLAPGTMARVTITPRQATVGELHLASGAQRLDLEGTVGLATDAESSLRVGANGVDIGDVLMLADQKIEADGVLTASATLGGTRERPLADGNLEITKGSIRKIDVQRLGGRVTFDGTLALIDLELVKDQYARLTARGVLPRTLLEGKSDEHVAATVADRLDVAIVSTPIDLAMAEGVSEYVTKLGGQAQMDVRVTGSGRDPHVEGAVFLTDGTFVVPMTGVTYKNIDAVLTFEEERVLISELGVETDNGDLLTVQGELGLSRQQARTVSMKMKGRDFRVLDNHYGVLDLDADVTISGTLLAPVIEGSLDVSDGRLELDEIVPEVANTNYATRAEYQGIPTARLRGAIVPDLLGAQDRAPELVAGTNTFNLGTAPVGSAVPPSGDGPNAPPPSPLGDPSTGAKAPAAGAPAANAARPLVAATVRRRPHRPLRRVSSRKPHSTSRCRSRTT